MARRGMRWGTSTWLIGCDVIGAGYPGSLWFHHKPKTTTQVVVDTSCAYCLDASTACTMLPANAGATHLDVPCRPISLQSQRYALLPAAIQRWKSTKEHTSAHAHTHTHTHTPARRAAGASAWCMRKVRRTENEKGHHGSSITSMPWCRRKLYYPYALRAPRAANSFSVCSFTALLNISYTCRQPFTASRRTACGRRTTCYNAAGGIDATPMPACTSYTSSGSLESICTSVTLFVLGSSATGSCGPPPFFSR